MRAGLVGFAGSGKSTLFQLMTGVTPDPGKVHSGQIGIAELLDPRVDFLAEVFQPKKVTRANVEFLDTPGLLPGNHADNPQRLALIRKGEALVIVLNGYDNSQDPAADLDAFREELVIADLGVLSNRVQTLEASVKKPRPDRAEQLKELETVKLCVEALEAGKTVGDLDLTEDQKKPMRSFGLLTDKAQLVLLNAPQGENPSEGLLERAPQALSIDGQLELELQQMDVEERAGFMEEWGISELGRDRIIRAAYDAVGIITFFTAGEPEVRGWNLERGANAVDAAGKIHTDLARGFIRAEVTSFGDFKEAGSVREAKARNLQRLEGKDYVVQDGDMMFFRSST